MTMLSGWCLTGNHDGCPITYSEGAKCPCACHEKKESSEP